MSMMKSEIKSRTSAGIRKMGGRNLSESGELARLA